ncbi:BamA/TamA family outer membrane protein [Scytonema hofmannii FACHB-248]|uniref:BamA/TamA family outer membrane protein n=1 Tax=Scytonema hofmannii FACHB-248 TaxID=1842502 RepID=A0ABR8GN52_9CYAN|nr:MULTISPECIES: BamA/TamA family outer membrane protein [Nostocales]MBD2604475.1 BamA/TamA family outer membrane protein [Scytonema hofmannii FACHB-248]
MRLSPVLVAALTIAAPLGSSLSANAQTPNSSKQKSVVLQPTTNQDSQLVNQSANVQGAEALRVLPRSISDVNLENLKKQPGVVAVFPANKPVVIIPSVTAPITAQNPPSNPNIPGSNTVPDIQPTETQQQVPSQTLPTLNPNQPTPEENQQPPNQQLNQPAPEENQQQENQQFNQPAPGENQQPPNQQLNQPAPEQNQQLNQPAPGENQQQENQQFNQPAPGENQQPPNQQLNQPTPGENQQNATPEATEARVLVSEVSVKNQAGQPILAELENQVYKAIRTQPGRTTTRSQLQQDINAIFGTGYFSNVQAVPEDTPLGVRVSFVVQPNPVLTKVQIQANPGTNVASVLPANAVDEIFKEQYGGILNLRSLQEGIKTLTKRYQDQGYVLANLVGAPQVAENGVVTLQVAEGVVENIRVRFRNKDGQDTDDKGQPIRGRTRDYIVKRELELKPGQVFNRNIIQKDLQRVFGLGLFEDINVSLDPGTDPSKVNVVVNVAERNSGSIAAGAGISSASGLFGTVSYQQQNLGGRNQKLGAEVQVGQRELLFDLRFTDPWIAGDPNRTSYTANIFRRQSISLIFDGNDENIDTFNPGRPDENGDRPRVIRTGGGITFTRPLSGNPFKSSEWTASAGFQYQRVSITDADGNIRRLGRVENSTDPNDRLDLSQSGEGRDDLLLLQLGAARDRRNNALQPTRGSFLRFGVDQSVPVGLGSIFLTRLRGSYSQYVPVKFTNFNKGAQTLAFNIQGGTVLGDLPPYEAFTLGGSNSVRGYEEGQLASSRSYVQASLEYRFPVFSVVSGALFFDVGSDLGSSTRAAELLNKGGTGYGYGLGVRVQSPLGPIRVDYGINDDGDSRINFGIGERF